MGHQLLTSVCNVMSTPSLCNWQSQREIERLRPQIFISTRDIPGSLTDYFTYLHNDVGSALMSLGLDILEIAKSDRRSVESRMVDRILQHIQSDDFFASPPTPEQRHQVAMLAQTDHPWIVALYYTDPDLL